VRRTLCLFVIASLLGVAGVSAIGQSTGLKIIHIEYSSNDDEIIVIFNPTRKDIDLTGYRIWSEGGQEFVFTVSDINPHNPVIRAYDVVRVHSGSSADSNDARDFCWLTQEGNRYRDQVWDDVSDVAKLFPYESAVPIATYSYP